ncbi:MAG: response regulator, partial [Acidobacteria bacterium]|nr:response regulator [Acidobacteriota bacterium]
MFHRLCVLTALLAFPLAANRPDSAPHSTQAQAGQLAGGLIDDRNWVRFGLADGLPSEQILDLIELPSGEVWVRTTAGLAWFDGYTFHPVTAEHGLPREGFLAFTQNLSGGLWILYNAGIYTGTSRGFQRLDVHLPHDEPGAAYAAPLGAKRMLVVGRTGRSYLWDGRNLSSLPPELTSLPWTSRRLHSTRSGAVWLSTRNGVYRVREDSHTLVLPAPPAPGGGGRSIDLYALDGAPGHGASLAVNITPFQVGYWEWMPGQPPRQIPQLSGHVVSALAVAPSGERVVVNRDGEILTGRGHDWTRLVFRPIPLRNVSLLRFRPNGELWSATGHGLYLWRRTGQLWTQAMPDYHELARTVHDILIHSDGSLWLATMAGVAVRSPKGDWKLLTTLGGAAVTMTTGVREDEQGNVWVVSGAGFGGAWRWDGTRWRHFGEAGGLTNASIHRLHRARDGALWFLSTGAGSPGAESAAGAYRLSKGKFERWGRERGVASSHIMSMAEGPRGELYFGTREGVSRYHQNRWRRWDRGHGLEGSAVFSMEVDRQGTLWFSTRGNGLYFLDRTGLIQRVGVPDGLAGGEIWEVKADPKGRLWTTTQTGLSMLDNGHWTRFPASSGLDNLHLWPIAFRGDEVCVGSLGGGLYCTQRLDAATRRTRAILADPQIKPQFTILRWRPVSQWGADPPTEIRTRYRLDGNPWSDWGQATELTVSGLRPGEHRFDVQTRGPLEPFPSTASHSFQVPLPFYRQWEFLLPMGVLASIVVLLLAVLARRHMRYQRELARSEARFRAIVDNSADIVVIFNRGGHITYTNKSIEKRLGYTPAEMAHHTFDLIHPDDRDSLKNAMEHSFANPGRVVQAPHRALHRDGGWRWMETELINLLHVPGISGVVAHSRDVTERREFQDKLAEAKVQAEQASKAKTDFLTTMSHEVRTPMNGILGMCGLLEETYLDPTQREFASIIRGSAHSLLTIVNDVLDLSRIEAGKMVFAHEPFSLEAVCHDSIDLLRPRALEQDISLLLDYPASLPRHFLGDGARIRQVVVNLVGNAVKFTPSGSVTLRVSAATQGDLCRVRVEVCDTGIGIAPDMLPRLFEKFTQADSSNSRRYGGSGLGLSISRSLIARMGGEIGADSEPGRGSRFWFELPLPLTDVHPPPSPGRAAIEPLPRARVLVVEDNRINQLVVARMLARLGLEIDTAGDGQEALHRVAQSPFDLILMDCQMPGMDGYEATMAIRRSELPSHHTPIIALTANAMDGERQRCLAAGMDDYLSKPVEIGHLSHVLARYLKPQPANAPA